MKNKYSELNYLVKTLQSHHHTQTCRKKKGVICRFKAPWPVTNETLIICKTENADKSKICNSKTVAEKVLFQAPKINDFGKVIEKGLLDIAGGPEAKYHEALGKAEKKITILHLCRLCEVYVVQYSYLTVVEIKYEHSICDWYLCYANIFSILFVKPRYTMSELMKKASKESYRRNFLEKLSAIRNVFITKHEVSTHMAI